MAAVLKESIFNVVDLHSKSNNFNHYTSEISLDRLIVRRGQAFKVTLNLKKPFGQLTQPIIMTAKTGKSPSEALGTQASFAIPDFIRRSPSAKAVWKIEIQKDDTTRTGRLLVSITPPPDCPVGKFVITAKHKEEEILLGKPVVLFNPWCPDDLVYMKNDKKRNEYVLNENGVIFRGSADYIHPLDWDFGQFEDGMVDICLKILDRNHKHSENKSVDVASRADPMYVGRVVSAMINVQDDHGVVEGRWSVPYDDGKRPGYWSGSHEILKKWFTSKFRAVKYGQCWVFAGVMCSVMRLLGIPTRVVTNFVSAHDTNMSLTIDTYYDSDGLIEHASSDSIWNYHVWVESWMRRPDLSKDGKYDKWQVLDPTPQEMSDGVFCCGPASVMAIKCGETALKYDVPFVFAEVNADIIDWKVNPDGSVVKLYSDHKRVGQNTSTKAIRSNQRKNITDKYKHKEGSEEERAVFKYASRIDYSSSDGDEEMEEEEDEETTEEVEEPDDNIEAEEAEGVDEEGEVDETGEVEETDVEEEEGSNQPPPLPVSIRFSEVTPPTNGKDVRLKLLLVTKSATARLLSIHISVQAMRYNGRPAGNIQKEDKEVTLQPGKVLSIPVWIKYSDYHTFMLESDSLKVTVMVTDKEQPENTYLAEDDVVLLDPPITVKVQRSVRVNQWAKVVVTFMNPLNKTLTDCLLTISGSGLLKQQIEYELPDLDPKHRVRIIFSLRPYKIGKKTLTADFDCSAFRDIKGSCTVKVKE